MGVNHMLDLVITNGKVVEYDGVFEEDLWIREGRIVARVKHGSANNAKKVIDADGRFILPGAIDTHSHIGMLPGKDQPILQTIEENIKSESLAALYGGVTTAINYIFTQDSMTKEIPRFTDLAKKYSRIDIKFHGALMNETHLSEIDKCIKMGIDSFKIFLPYKGEEALNLGGLSSLNDGQLLEAFIKLRQFGGLPIVHSENPEMIDYFMEKNMDLSRQDMSAWENTRPGIVEGESVQKVVYLAEKTNCRVCIAHVSSADAVDIIKNTKADVLLETCPHYLTLTTDAGLDSLGKVSPPIRHSKDKERLWQYIEEGHPVIIGSDHNAWSKLHKKDLWQGLAGLPGNTYILPALITEGVSKRNLSMSDIVRITSFQGAKEFGVYPLKGTLQVGSIADIVIMDTNIKKKVQATEIPSIVDYSPYENYDFTAWPFLIIKDGVPIEKFE